jgi:acyl-CoA thioester hydrolase
MMPEPRHAGRLAAGVHTLSVRVYYEDTDFSGAVYHANYLKFCERGRSDFLRHGGIHHSALHADANPAAFVVRRMLCDFLKPARIDDLLDVETRLVELAGARMELEQRVLRAGEILFQAAVTVVLVDARGRPKRITLKMRDALLAIRVSPAPATG